MVTIRLDRASADKLAQLADDCDCSRDELLIEAITLYVDEQSHLIAGIKAGEADMAAGRFVTHEQLMGEIRSSFPRKDAA